jgi:hypothetical protein
MRAISCKIQVINLKESKKFLFVPGKSLVDSINEVQTQIGNSIKKDIPNIRTEF